MRLSDKIGHLREVEGSLRGLGRALTQSELVRLLREELGEALSQSYLSQIESGARPHLTNTSRQLLARFFKVHPGYLVDDPEGYDAHLLSEARSAEGELDAWLFKGAERFRKDPQLHDALLAVARHSDSRACLLALASDLDLVNGTKRLRSVLPSDLSEQASVEEQGASEDPAALHRLSPCHERGSR